MRRPSLRTLLLLVLSGIVLLAAGAAYLLPRLIDLNRYKEQILATLTQSLNRQVLYEQGEVSFRFGPSFTFTGVTVKERDGSGDLLAAERVTFKLALLPLLEKKAVVREIAFEKPRLTLVRFKDGTFNISDLLEQKEEAIPLQVDEVWLHRATIRFIDRQLAPDGYPTTLEQAEFFAHRLHRGKTTDFKLAAELKGTEAAGSFTIGGSVKLPAADRPLGDAVFSGKLLTKGLQAAHFWPYYQRYVPFQKVLGQFDLDTSFKGTYRAFTSRGRIRVAGLRFDYQPIFHAVLTPREVTAAYELELNRKDLTVTSLDASVDGLRVKGSCALRDIFSADPFISARATTTAFQLEKFYAYIPFGIIVDDVATFIEQHIKGGIYQLLEGKLDGRISQILHMERGENYNVLSVRATVERGLVTFGAQVPTFNGVKGELELRGKDFNLHKISGNFGTSPFTLEGKITDYPLDKPSAYPFTMAVTPARPDVAWLLGKEWSQRFSFSGSSTLNLTGTGFTSGYTLNGDWNLTPTAYSYPNVVNKPAGTASRLSFRAFLTKQDLKVSDLQFQLAPLNLALTADYRFAGSERLTFDVKTRPAPVAEIVPFIPRLQRYQPQGRVEINLHGESTAPDLADLHWRGSLSCAGVSLLLTAGMKPLQELNGTVRFGSDSLESSQLAFRLGNSTITGRGRVASLANPTAEFTFLSPQLDLADLGLRHAKEAVKVQQAEGSFTLRDNNLQIKSLSGTVRSTPLVVRGTVTDLRAPRTDVTVTSPKLDVEDVLLLTALERSFPPNGRPTPLNLKASVTAESGRFQNVNFQKLVAGVLYENRILYLEPLAFQTRTGGRCSGKLRIDFAASGGPRYQVGFALEKVSAEETFTFLNSQGLKLQSGMTTGQLTMRGDLTSKGETLPELKKSLLGTLKIHQERGTLKKYGVLSKVFSILNVSQLFKFKLPDMVSGGMPYDSIKATFSYKDGIMSTNDTFIASEAINISVVGKVDLLREQIDLLIGVQPLQTIDKVVNRIPVVGWILTGKDKSLVTTYFEAKGKWDDPDVSAIPVKSISRGTLGIFIRLFQLPVKLFTDTGEVLLGGE